MTYAWARVDPWHGHGGRVFMGRLRQAGDPGFGEAWTWAGFAAALQADEDEINDVVRTHPQQSARLRDWLVRIEALGRQRDDDPAPQTGQYYEALAALGHVSA